MSFSTVPYQVGDEIPILDSLGNESTFLTPATQSKALRPKDRFSSGWIFTIQIVGICSVIHSYGSPLDTWTQCCLFLYVLLVSWLCLRPKDPGVLAMHVLTFAFLGSLIVPLQSDWDHDTRTGRQGVFVHPWNFRFGFEGPNTKLIERYTGWKGSFWRHRAIRSRAFQGWSDYEDRVNSQNFIFSPELPRILALLPDEAARKKVVCSLADMNNLLRVHQCMLLAYLDTKNKTEEFNVKLWWAGHQAQFNSEHVPLRAVYRVRLWTNSCAKYVRRKNTGERKELFRDLSEKISAARSQERGKWGGCLFFSDAWYSTLSRDYSKAKMNRELVKRGYREISDSNVDWWR